MEEWITWGSGGDKEELERQAKRLLSKFNNIIDTRIVVDKIPMWWILEYLQITSRKDRIKQTTLDEFGAVV